MSIENKDFSRRDFAKMGTAAAVAALGATMLSGCSSSDSAAQPATEPAKGGVGKFVPMTEEERAAAIADPVYMGGSHYSSGTALELGEYSNGAICPKPVADREAEFAPALHKVNDRVYVSVGNCISNSTMILTDNGFIVIDTSEGREIAEKDLAAFRTVTDKPCVGAIATHDHYFNGTAVFVGDGNPDNLPVIVQSRFFEALRSTGGGIAPCTGNRSLHQFGGLLPKEGPDASAGAGLGAFIDVTAYGDTSSFVQPNVFIPADEPVTKMTIDGLEIEFYPRESDSFANMNMYFPQLKTAVTNSVWPCFFNMYTLRASRYRDPQILLDAIDEIRSWNPEYHCSAHGLPLIGLEETTRELRMYRDGIAFVYDQTRRFMNQNMEPDEIVRYVNVPPQIVNSKQSKPFYGDVEHYVRGVYSGIIGWFGVDGLELHPIDKTFESKKIVGYMGGVDAAVEEAQNCLDDNQYAWAATLASHIMRADPECANARNIKAQALRKMAYVCPAANSRNWMMSNALELEGAITFPPPSMLSVQESSFATAPVTHFFDVLRVNIVPERCADLDKSMQFIFTDRDETVAVAIHNCVSETIVGTVDNPNVTLTMPYALIPKLATGQMTFAAGIEAGQIQLSGERADLDEMIGSYDMKL